MSASVLLIAGEPSGDQRAARLVRAIRKQRPDVRFFGVGGDALRAEGMEILYDCGEMAVMGLTEVLRRYGFFKRVFADLARRAAEQRPDAVLLVDYPGFNLRFARRAHDMGLKVLYYICPQVWAWHRSRMGAMAKTIDRLMVLFPFEAELFRNTGLKVDVVGHPLVDELKEDAAMPAQPHAQAPTIALLPGSRRQEVERMLPVMVRAAGLLADKRPALRFVVAAASEAIAEQAQVILARTVGTPGPIELVVGQTRSVVSAARAAWVTSGTATLETALLGCPLVVVYKTAWSMYLPARLLIRVPHIGLVNIVAGRGVCPERIQHRATPRALLTALEPLIDDTPERQRMLEAFETLGESLSPAHAPADPASIVLEELDKGPVGRA